MTLFVQNAATGGGSSGVGAGGRGGGPEDRVTAGRDSCSRRLPCDGVSTTRASDSSSCRSGVERESTASTKVLPRSSPSASPPWKSAMVCWMACCRSCM